MFRTMRSCCFIAAGAAAFMGGCSGSNPAASSSEATSAANEALTFIKHCQADSSKCEADAGDAGKWGCDDKYRVCLGAFSSDGGIRFDGGGFPFDDAGFPTSAPKDAGPHLGDDIAKIDACIDDLHECIEAKTALDTCADDAVHCIEEALAPSGGGGSFVFPFPHEDGGFSLPHHDGGRP